MLKFSRRAVVAGLGAALSLSWLRAWPKAQAATPPDSVLPDGFIRIPAWCPNGFAPCAGQRVVPQQFPALFEKNGRFYPMFYGKESARLPLADPIMKDDIGESGWMDHLTIVPRTEPDKRIQVQVIAVRDHVWPSGRVAHAGFMHTVLVDPQVFSETLAYLPELDENWNLSDRNSFLWYGAYSSNINGPKFH